MNDVRVRVLRELLGRFEEENEGFMWWIVTGDEAWIHHYDPENRRQSMEYCHNHQNHRNSKGKPHVEKPY